MVAAVLFVQFISITLAGYAFARIDFYEKNVLFMLFLTQMMVSADVLIMPNYKLISSLGLSDTRIGVILPFFASAMGILMMRQTVILILNQPIDKLLAIIKFILRQASLSGDSLPADSCLVCNKIMLENPHTFLMKTGS